MESNWLLFIAGLSLGFSVAMAIIIRWPSGSRKDSPQVSREDFEGLRLFVDDAVDKIEHVYDRLRKRRMVEEPPKASPEGSTPSVDGKNELRAIARARGLLR